MSNVWKKFPPTHRPRDTAHAQYPQTHCQWYPMGDANTHNSRTDIRKIFKLGAGVTWSAVYDQWPRSKGQRSRSQGRV